jgi:hypothetical protein
MRVIWLLAALLGGLALPAAAGAPAKQTIVLYEDYPDGEALVVPASSPVRLASFTRENEVTAKFEGRFNLSGRYEAQGHGEEVFVSFWPDPASARRLPAWRERGRADVLYLDNGWAFVQAVATPIELERLRNDEEYKLRGRANIVADEYWTGIECDGSHFGARFVSLVRNQQKLASIDLDADDC